jgi:hypothetical protein
MRRLLPVALACLPVALASAAQADPPRDAIAARFHQDPPAATIALRLYDRDAVTVDVESPHTMDGGYRGTISIVPALPVHTARNHLAWADAAFADFDTFFTTLGLDPARYARHPSRLRYFRSVGKRTPSAYAMGETIAYNVDGSLMTSADAVRETLFHELFHLNDQAHNDWSDRALAPITRAVIARCGARTECLAPYAPGTTRVRGGTFYAFQPGNGPGEYAAELALRYYLEHRALQRGERARTRFKCGPAENAQAWKAIVDEMFGGIDRIPPCA